MLTCFACLNQYDQRTHRIFAPRSFERNAEDVFHFEFPDLGSIPEIEIGHDNAGVMPGWHCAKVMVEDQTAQQRYIYPCDR